MARLGYGSTFGFLIGIVTVALGGAFVYKSVAPVLRLRPVPPASFMDLKTGLNPKQRAAEERVARAYWEVARRLSHSVYSFTDRLPDAPPDAFSVDPNEYPSLTEPSEDARYRYWRNLHKVWTRPEAWQRSYEWHTSWLFQGTSY